MDSTLSFSDSPLEWSRVVEQSSSFFDDGGEIAAERFSLNMPKSRLARRNSTETKILNLKGCTKSAAILRATASRLCANQGLQ
jgi:hypothetical protein